MSASDQPTPSSSTTKLDARAPDHPPAASGKVGVLVVNLGTPDATDYWSMRRYLKEFLSDRRVVEMTRWIWWPLLNLVILTIRPKRSGAAYDRVWNTERDESPLRTITRAQSDGLGQRLAEHDPRIIVDWAMRYGQPTIANGLARLKETGCDRILLAPLYPQYSASTTATVNDTAFDALKTMRWQPALRILPPYYDTQAYIDALKTSVDAHIASLDYKPEAILASFHGLPQAFLDNGDPYYCHCQKTARLLREALGLDENGLQVSFQSRVGRAEWLKPYTDATLRQLPGRGVHDLVVITPGFSADCLETLEEIAMEGGETFKHHGGKRFTFIPCLNDSENGMKALESIILQELKGWI